MSITKTNFGGLTTYVVSEIPDGERPELAVVLCHGYGATGRDLIDVVKSIGIVKPGVFARTVFLCPAGPLDLSDAGIPYGRAWWHIDLDRLLNHPTAELLMQFRRGCPEGLPEARAMLEQLIAEAGHGMGLAADRFVLGGFSQGAMLATDVALRMKTGPAGLCILSGALINEIQWRELAPKHLPLTILQSHGRQDPILMYPQATALRDLLNDSGHEVEFVPFEGYHEIPPVVVHRMAEMIARCQSEGETGRGGESRTT